MQTVFDHLNSDLIKQKFNCNQMYDYMETKYIKNPDINQHEEQIDFMKNPVKYFEKEANLRKKALIDDKIEDELFQKYKEILRKNLTDFKKRVNKVKSVFEKE